MYDQEDAWIAARTAQRMEQEQTKKERKWLEVEMYVQISSSDALFRSFSNAS